MTTLETVRIVCVTRPMTLDLDALFAAHPEWGETVTDAARSVEWLPGDMTFGGGYPIVNFRIWGLDYSATVYVTDDDSTPEVDFCNERGGDPGYLMWGRSHRDDDDFGLDDLEPAIIAIAYAMTEGE